ncbi:LamG-like jellyroll fold domain-containing protein [Dyella sp.]|uniref:LamG-like jellyroll fold domain-containing protein n=1 Tax=Dyella sp. TaxID=1869338 RepID=UPI00284B0313|nr:LamG-like jellyroll fold domain-containing protein [Dyella sp.]MDR3444692.1 hypothetical protein [Dyella sp.]
MGKGSKATVGYWYRVAYHAGLGIGPIDAFLEFRGGDQTAWAGNLTSSGTITINAPNLWGGEKDQGGISGDVDVMFGEATQQPNTYLASAFGSQQPAWRGLATVAFKGGRYGAMNPYPQKPSYKFTRILKGWDNDVCWYPEHAQVSVLGGGLESLITDFKTNFQTNAPTKFQLLNGAIANTTVNALNTDYWRIATPFADVTSLYCEFKVVTPGGGDPLVIALTDAAGNHIVDFCPLTENRVDALQRPAVNYFGSLVPIYTGALTIGQTYSFEAEIDPAARTFTYWLRVASTVLSTGTAPLGAAWSSPAWLTFARTGNADVAAVSQYSLVQLAATGSAMNPAHILYDARTQQDMGREPIGNMNDASFRAAADWYFTQGFGLCTEYDPAAETLDDFIARSEKVAGCSMSRSPIDGMWYLDVANGMYDLASLPILSDDDILDFAETPSTMDSATNSVSIQYFDPGSKETVATAPVQALALVDAFGTISEQTSYPEIPSGDLALRVATRDLLASVTPTRTFDLTTTRLPYAWRVGTYFRLQSPKRGIADMVCLLAEKSSGTLKSGAIKITASQDIYSLPETSFVDTEHGVDTRPSQTPSVITQELVFEAPYLDLVRTLSRADLLALPADAGYLLTVAADPATSLDYTITVSSDGGTTWGGNTSALFCPMALIVGSDTLSGGAPAKTFTFSNGAALSTVKLGSVALWGSELVRVDALDLVASTVTLGRGCVDTPPVPHAANEAIWFFDDFNGSDFTEYTEGETIDVKLLTNTGNNQLDPSNASIVPLLFNGRQARPYAPGNLLVNGTAYPTVALAPLTISWAHRDRTTQADQLIDTATASIGPEAGVTYTVRTYLNGTLDSTVAGITGNSTSLTPSGFGALRVEVEADRAGLASWKPLAANFAYNANLQITSPSPIKFVAGTASTYQLTASGGLPPLSFSVDSSTPLPAGVTMSSGGLISASASTAGGDTVVKFIVSDSAGNSTNAPLTIDVAVLFVNVIDALLPVAHWRMNETVGSTALIDRVASVSAPLTGTAGTTYTLGATGLVKNDTDKAVLFNSGYAATVADAKWALGTGDFSAFCIAKWTSSAFATMAALRDSSTNIMFLFTVNRTAAGQVGVESWNWNNEKLIASDKAYNDGKPHALGVTYDSTSNTMRLYVDGALKVTQVQSGSFTRPTTATMGVRIANNFGSQQFLGTFDEFILFNHKLSDSDMANLAAFASAT